MSTLEMILLAIVQGITEFLPISSDGHLAVVNALLQAGGKGEVPDLLETTIVLHLGTLASVLIFYRREIIRLLTTNRRAILPLIAATIPAGVIGVGIEKGLPDETTKWLLESPLFAGFGFFITAAALWWLGRTPEGTIDYPATPAWKAVIIGFFQAAAILPGVSRSGLTISSGVGLGLRREAAATFSFLMAIPVIGGAGLLKIKDAVDKGTTSTPLPTLALGFVVSMLVGIAALWVLLRMLRRGRLELFVYYLVPLGIAVTSWQLLK
ncbi:MAG: undecaprenyl-diphosphate phosphatase [Pirellula sp.]|nr:undecaprenyl-diphosphate phosphatase [Pirellula sp.]